MANVRLENGTLIVTMQGLRKILTFKSELSFPLSSVRGITHDPNVGADYPNVTEKRKGTNVPNTYYGGTFKQDGDTIFWDVRDTNNTVVISLDDAEFQRLIIEVDDPKATVREVEQAINTAS